MKKKYTVRIIPIILMLWIFGLFVIGVSTVTNIFQKIFIGIITIALIHLIPEEMPKLK